MKISKEQNTLHIKKSGWSQVVVGAITLLIGLGVGFFGVVSDGIEEPLLVYVVAGAFSIFGAAFLALAKHMKASLQLGGQSHVVAKRVIGGKTERQDFATNDITGVELVTNTQRSTRTGSSSRGSSTQFVSELFLVLANGDRVKLGKKSKQGTGVAGVSVMLKAPLSKEANEIAEFLGVPLNGGDPGGSMMDKAKNAFKSAGSGQGTVSHDPVDQAGQQVQPNPGDQDRL